MKCDLVHFVEWKRVGDGELARVMAEVASWGVRRIVAHPNWFREDDAFIASVAQIIRANGLDAPACHALWGPGNDCVQRDEAAHRTMIAKHTRFLGQLAALEVKTYTIHLGMPDDRQVDADFDRIRRTVDELLPAAQRAGIALALENSAESPAIIARLAALAASYRSEYVGLCFDCGHANCYQHGVKETLEIMRDGIVTCHLHDNHGSFDDHNPPGDGNIDWGQLSALLDSCPRLKHAETESGDWSRESWEKFRAAVR